MISPYLSHGDSPFLSESVVIEVEDAEVWVVLHCRGQGCHTGVIDAILGHMNLLQAAHQLGTQTVIVRYKLLSSSQPHTENSSLSAITYFNAFKEL